MLTEAQNILKTSYIVTGLINHTFRIKMRIIILQKPRSNLFSSFVELNSIKQNYTV